MRPLWVSLHTDAESKQVMPRVWSWSQMQEELTRHTELKEKGGMLWSPTFYLEGTTRAKKNVASICCFVLDIDDGSEPDAFIRFWSPYTFLIYSTFSSTRERPMWRAVFPLKEDVELDGDFEAWYPIWGKLSHALALGHQDEACKDPSRIYWFPTCPLGDTDHFSLVHEGEWLDPLSVPDVSQRIVAKGLTNWDPSRPRVPRIEAGERVRMETLIARAMEVVATRGRQIATLWFFCQTRDNDYTREDAWGGFLTLLHLYPSTNTKGDLEPYTEARGEKVWKEVFSTPPRTPWGTGAGPSGPSLKRSESNEEDEEDAPTEEPQESPPKTPVPSGGKIPPILLVIERPVKREGDGFDFGGVYNLAGLQGAPVSPPPAVIEDLIMVGCNELFGHPKLGKSFVALGLAVPVVLGGIALSRFPCIQGEALYLAAEDAPWRMKERAGSLLEDVPEWPEGFWITHEWGLRMTTQGREKLEEWLVTRPETRMVVLDPWHAFRVPYPKGGDVALMDYDAFKFLNMLGSRYNCGIVVVHHASKRSSEDGINNASGSHGIAAGAGTILEMRRVRQEQTAELIVSGRDVRIERTWALARDERTGHWNVVGDAAEVEANANRILVWETLSENGPMRPRQLAEMTGIVLPTVQSLCRRMLQDGELTNEFGTYAAARDPRAPKPLF